MNISVSAYHMIESTICEFGLLIARLWSTDLESTYVNICLAFVFKSVSE